MFLSHGGNHGWCIKRVSHSQNFYGSFCIILQLKTLFHFHYMDKNIHEFAFYVPLKKNKFYVFGAA